MSSRYDASRMNRREFLMLAAAGAGLALGGSGCAKLGRTAGAAAPVKLPPGVPGFDADRAFSYLVRQVDFGPRVPGTAPHAACRDYLASHFRSVLGSSVLQPLGLLDGRKRIPMWNVISESDPCNPVQLLLCAHWDTRPQASQEADLARRNRPIPGANDGASGVAVLMEIAAAVAKQPPKVGVRFVLFDGEDYGPHDDRMYLGAKHYARNLPRPNPKWGVLLDMIGDRDLQIWREVNSQRQAGWVNDLIWKAAARAGHGDVFHDGQRWQITDDHLPLLAAGLPVVDLIDFDYPYWHTLADTVDKCSPASLRAVGETVLTALYT